MKSLPLLVRPAGVITPTTHHRLPSSKPSRHALPVRLPWFSHAGHVIFRSQTGELRKCKKHVQLMPFVFDEVPWAYSSSDLPGSQFHHEGMLVLQTGSAGFRPQPIQVVAAACKSLSHVRANLTLVLFYILLMCCLIRSSTCPFSVKP
jgi:hypothetical protein